MSRNGSGVYNLPAGNPVITQTTISSNWANTTLSDIATALTNSIASDGQTPMTGQLDMNSQKIKNLAAGTVAGNAVEYDQFIAAFTDPTITGDLTVNGNLFVTLDGEFSGTGALKVPSGTTAEQPMIPIDGMIRYNSTTGGFEGYINGAWGSIGGGATGGGGDQVFVENEVTVTANYTLTTGRNAESVGPISINSGVAVTIPSGQRWLIL
jgi:hypothetical protein